MCVLFAFSFLCAAAGNTSSIEFRQLWWRWREEAASILSTEQPHRFTEGMLRTYKQLYARMYLIFVTLMLNLYVATSSFMKLAMY